MKQEVAGIEVPKVATALELRCWVHLVYVTLDENCAVTAEAMGVTPATIWKLENGEQVDSQILRDSLGIRKTPPRPRVWMPTNNIEAAVKKLYEHYNTEEIVSAMMAVWSDEDHTGLIEATWYGTGDEGGFPGLELND